MSRESDEEVRPGKYVCGDVELIVFPVAVVETASGKRVEITRYSFQDPSSLSSGKGYEYANEKGHGRLKRKIDALKIFAFCNY